MKNRCFLTLFLLGCLQITNAQTVAIPDTAFEQKLIEFNIDTDGLVNGQIQASDALSIGTLDLRSSSITDLTGIEVFVNVVTLLCSDNNITTVNLSTLLSLNRLDIASNNIDTLDLSNNLALRELSCAYNNLLHLDLGNATALEELNCRGNSMSSLDISNQVILKYLDCSVNNLNSLDLSNNTVLENLTCESNALNTLDLSANPLLKTIVGNHNNMTGSLNLFFQTNLIDLNVSYNSLSSLDSLRSPVLDRIYCVRNNINHLDLSNSPALNLLYISYNNISSLDLSNNYYLSRLSCAENNLSILDVSQNTNLTNLTCQNNNLSSLDVRNNPALVNLSTVGNASNLKICVLDAQAAYSSAFWYKDPSSVYTEGCYPLALVGQVAIDDNLNCLVDSLEGGFAGLLIECTRISDGVKAYFLTYDSLGRYRAYLDTGTYTIQVLMTNPYWQTCLSTQQITVLPNLAVQTLNWALEAQISCPLLEVDLAAPFLRMTGGGSNYVVSYCNTGTLAASNVYVEVDIDSGLNVMNTSLPIATQVGTVYTFILGTVDVGECNSFDINVVVDTSAVFEETHCSEAHIYPDSICDITWTGPIINGAANCQNDTVFFVIDNIGAVMTQPQTYTIFEDNIAMRTGNISLGTGQSTTIVQAAAAGSTYRIEVEQANGYPATLGDLVFSRVIEGCKPFPDGSFNTGYVTQFSNGYSAPFMAIDCQQNVASYDPNDKAAQPVGYGMHHYIEKNTAIDYKIRFQNTGTDTAFNIVIIDTLSSHLEFTSLKMGASSHAYTWTIDPENVLKIIFPNIMLVDSNANEFLSHGFIHYKIEQKENNSVGALIENQAAIYFDYNPAIFTNTTFHTINEKFVNSTVSVDKIYAEDVSVKVYPNPFESETTIEVEGNKRYRELELSIFDLSGRQVESLQTSRTNKIRLSRDRLNTGIYIYQLKGDGNLLNTGKVIVQ